jgi:hypothetical protein
MHRFPDQKAFLTDSRGNAHARKPEPNSHSSRVFRTPPMSSRLAAPGLAHTDFAANSVALFGPVKLSNIALRWLKPAPNLEET